MVRRGDGIEVGLPVRLETPGFAGASSGANVVAALRIAARLGPRGTVVTVLVDSGLKYLSTDVYDPED